MKLLFDANLSPRLVPKLSELFPGSIHLFDTTLVRYTSDEAVWDYAKAGGYTIVRADSDFIDLAERRGVPPGIVRLDNCNYKTARVEELIRRNRYALRTPPSVESSYCNEKPRECRD